MGLDMYLTKQIYVGAKWEHRKVTGRVSIKVDGVRLPVTFKKISYIIEEAIYWRKANAIHRWFVDNCQDGTDECQKTYVSRENLAKLLDVCKRVKKNHVLAGELLPTQNGFFFGSTEYDEWYWEDINYTIKAITNLLKKDDEEGTFYYQADW